MEVKPHEPDPVHPSGTSGSYFGPVYAGVKAGDVCLPPVNDTATAEAASLQVAGEFGGATVYVDGTLDGLSWYPLHDLAGITIAIRLAGIRSIAGPVIQVRPRVSGGDKTTNLDITMMFRRA